MKSNRILAVALSAGLVLAGGVSIAQAAEKPAETVQDVENNEVGYKTKEAAEKAAQAALDAQEKGKEINYSFTINQTTNGKYMYLLSPAKSEKPEQQAPVEEEKAENNENGYKTEAAAKKAGEAALKDAKLEDSYQVEVRKEASLNKDKENTARYFYRFVLKEEVKPTPDKKPNPEVKPSTPDTKPSTPDTTPAAPAENDKEVDKLIKDLNDSEKKINDLLEQNEKENAELNKKDKKEKDKKEDKKENKKAKKQAPAKQGTNPKTGVVGLGSVASLAAISMAGIVATRKRK